VPQPQVSLPLRQGPGCLSDVIARPLGSVWYLGADLEEAIERAQLSREAKWTESLAVGSEAFAREVGPRIRNRMAVEVMEEAAEPGSWVVREASPPYG